MKQLLNNKLYLLIILLGIFTYGNSLFNGFSYDAENRILENPNVVEQTKLTQFFVVDYWSNNRGINGGAYRPLTTLSLNLSYRLFGPKAFAFHATDLIIHLLNALLCYFLLLSLFNNRLLAFCSSAFFVVHPLTTESLNHLVTRGNLLATLFLLLSLIAFLKVKKGAIGQLNLLAMSALCYFFSLLCKESTIAFLPLYFFIYYLKEGYPRSNKEWPDILLQLTPLTLVLGTYLLIRFVVLGSLTLPPSVHYFQQPQIFTDQAMILSVLWRYFYSFLWPLNLSADYSPLSLPVTTSLFSPLPLLAVSATALWIFSAYYFKKVRKIILFSLIFFFCAWLPVSSLVIQLAAIFCERFCYLTTLPLSLVLALPLCYLWQRERQKYLAIALCVLILLLFSGRSIVRNNDWKNTLNLLEHDSRLYPDSLHLRLALARLYFDRQQTKLAFAQLIHVLQLEANNQQALIGLAKAASLTNNLQQGIALLEKYQTEATAPSYFFNLATLYRQSGNLDRAQKYYWQSIKIKPTFAKAWVNLGHLYRGKKNLEQALSCYLKACQLKPLDSQNWNNLGALYLLMKKDDQAEEALSKAIELDPFNAKPFRNLALIYLKKGNLKLAYRLAGRLYQLNNSEIDRQLLCKIAALGSVDLGQLCLAQKKKNN